MGGANGGGIPKKRHENYRVVETAWSEERCQNLDSATSARGTRTLRISIFAGFRGCPDKAKNEQRKRKRLGDGC